MRNEIKYIVPDKLRHIDLPKDIINKIKQNCQKYSSRTKIVLIGEYNGNIYVSWEGDKLPKYANTPIVTAVDMAYNIIDLSPMESIQIKNKAYKDGIIL